MTREEWTNYVKEAVKECIEQFDNINTLAKVKGICNTTLRNWLNGKNTPKVDTFLKAFPEYNFEGIEACNFEYKGATTKSTRPLPKPKKAPEPAPEPVHYSTVCDNCIHNKICKYREAFEMINAALQEKFQELAAGIPVAQAALTCDVYIQELERKINSSFSRLD